MSSRVGGTLRAIVATFGVLVFLVAGRAPADEPAPATSLAPTGVASRDGVGSSVASDGTNLIAAALGVDSPGCSSTFSDCSIRGGAYAFEFVGDAWTQRALPIPTELADGALFGIAVDLDDTTAVVGAPATGFAGQTGLTGNAYVFVKDGDDWVQQQRLGSSDESADDAIGQDVAISGETILIGAPGEGTGGAAYVFTRDGATWTQQQQLVPGDLAAEDRFGESVDIDGDTIVVGAPGANGVTAINQGAAYVFVRANGRWTEQQRLDPSEDENVLFGSDVAVDGDVAVVGGEGPTELAVATIFVRDDASWFAQPDLFPDTLQTPGFNTVAVAVSGDKVALGYPGEIVAGAGAAGRVFVYERDGEDWALDCRVVHPQPELSDRFGGAVHLHGDALFVGAPRADDGVEDGGAVYVDDGIPAVDPPDEIDPPPGTIRSFVLPTRVSVRVGAVSSKPRVKAKAVFDTGAGAVDFTQPAQLTIGPRVFDLPGLVSQKNGKRFVFEGPALTVTVTPSKRQTSRAVLNITLDEDLGGAQDLDGGFTLSYVGGGIDATGSARLAAGGFKFGKRAGELSAPSISLKKAKAKLRGSGRDQFVVQIGFTTADGRVPPTSEDVTVTFGTRFQVTIPGGDFTRKGAKDSFKGRAGGITSVVLDYAKERAVIKAKDVDLGPVADGAVPLLIILTRGDDVRAVEVGAVRKKATLQY